MSNQVRRPERGVVRGAAARRSGQAAPRSAAAVCAPPTVVEALGGPHQGRSFRSAPLSAHVAYLERDGVTRDGEKGCMFGVTEDRTDAMGFARHGLNDRHHFRFVVTPEDAAEMTDLRAFTRDLVGQMGERSRHQAELAQLEQNRCEDARQFVAAVQMDQWLRRKERRDSGV